jgi:hypothetical protein
MYLAQVPRTPGVRLAAIADLSPANAKGKPRARRLAGGARAQTPISEDWRKARLQPAQSTS